MAKIIIFMEIKMRGGKLQRGEACALSKYCLVYCRMLGFMYTTEGRRGRVREGEREREIKREEGRERGRERRGERERKTTLALT